MKKSFFYLIVLLMFSNLLLAQHDGDEISIGKYRILDSQILNEERTILIHLPDNYEKFNKSYPVLYMLYGNHTNTYFAEAVSILEQYGSSGLIPEMILVAITNTNRYRDLLPLNRDGSKTGIDNFLEFFRTEFVPFIENNYRTKDYRVLMGPQAGANFSMYTMFKDPNLFNAFIINNPFRWSGGRNLLLENARSYFEKNNSLKKFMFITHDNSDKYELKGNEFINKFADLVAKEQPIGFQLELNYLKESKDFITPLGLRKGIKLLFKDYAFPQNKEVNNLSDIVNYYSSLSEELGYEIDVPGLVLVMKADKLLAEAKTKDSIEILEYMIEKKALHENAYWRLSDINFKAGNLLKAKAYLDKMLELVSGDVGMIKDRYNEIVKMIEEKK